MQRVPISLDERIDARFIRRSTSECWWWQGSLREGRPVINHRHIIRYLYEREIAPIPPGMTLWRKDHTPDCEQMVRCRHWECVNPWHVRLSPIKGGLQEREGGFSIHEARERTAEYKRRVRKNRRDREQSNGASETADP